MSKNFNALAIEKHKLWGGKFKVEAKCPLNNKDDLSIAYTPGVAAVCLEIAKDKQKAYEFTAKKNMVAVITDGSAVLGLGNIGPEAAIPVMEGKAILFKHFANIDAIPISLATQNTEEIIAHVKAISPSFAGINLEDISAPRCFEIEKRLKEELDIPVFHDDQHGTAIVVLAALFNALRLTKKSLDSIDIVINGAGAAGIAIAHLLLAAGAKKIKMVGREGIISSDLPNLRESFVEIAKITNLSQQKGDLGEALNGTDIFIGVSSAGAFKADFIKKMNEKPIIFALANPIPEIMPDEAFAAGAFIVGTGRSDFSNQINNVLAFPGVFRGALDAQAKSISQKMCVAAATAIANLVLDEKLKTDYILPSIFDENVTKVVAESVKNAV